MHTQHTSICAAIMEDHRVSIFKKYRTLIRTYRSGILTYQSGYFNKGTKFLEQTQIL